MHSKNASTPQKPSTPTTSAAPPTATDTKLGAKADTIKDEPLTGTVPPDGAPTEATSKPTAAADVRTAVTIMVPERLGRQIRLLASLQNVTISSIFLSAVAREVPEKLRAALAEVEGDLT
jgi:hypothetical protein